MNGLRTLDQLGKGESGRITRYLGGSGAYRAKLLALGLTRGTRVSVVNVAPLGDPIDVEVRDFNLSLRRGEARVLEVRTEEDGE